MDPVGLCFPGGMPSHLWCGDVPCELWNRDRCATHGHRAGHCCLLTPLLLLHPRELPEHAVQVSTLDLMDPIALCPCLAPPQSPYLGCHVQEFVDSQLDAFGGLEKIHQASYGHKHSNEYPGLISFRMDWLDLLAVQRVDSLEKTLMLGGIGGRRRRGRQRMRWLDGITDSMDESLSELHSVFNSPGKIICSYFSFECYSLNSYGSAPESSLSWI